MSDDARDLIDELTAALDVDPSREFAARVRQRLDRETSNGWYRPKYLLGLAGAAVLVWMALMALPERDPVAPVQPSIAHRIEPLPDPVAQSPALPERTVRPRVKRVPVPATSLAHEPEVLILPERRTAFEQLKRAISGGQLTSSNLPDNLSDIGRSGLPAQEPPSGTDGSLGGRDELRKFARPPSYTARMRLTTS
jgi:hypothetical protein